MLDLAQYPTSHNVTQARIEQNQAILTWSDGRISRFHAIWLRDNCPCSLCRHAEALERRYLLLDELGEISLTSVEILSNERLSTSFFSPSSSSHHQSQFTFGWLRAHDYGETAAREGTRPLRLWTSLEHRELPAFEFQSVMTSDQGLYDWLSAWREWGAALLCNAPARQGEVTKIAERIGPLRPTNFGTHYDVKTMPLPNASAYTPMALEPHTDLANWQSPPDCQLLFCIANEAQGGGSVLVDGFSAVQSLRQKHPEAFELLSAREIEFRFHDETCDIRRHAKVIDLHADGSVRSVRFNNWLRSTLDLPPQDVQPYYHALLALWRSLRDPEFCIRPRLRPGDMFMLDNHRILHGRDAFDPHTGLRHLQGCYVDRDFILSRVRVLQRVLLKNIA